MSQNSIKLFAEALLKLITIMPALCLIYLFPYDVDSFTALVIFKAFIPCLYIGISVFGFNEDFILNLERLIIKMRETKGEKEKILENIDIKLGVTS